MITSYDCQKNFPLPKILDQATHYSRQICPHNFTVVQRNFKVTPNNVASSMFELKINSVKVPMKLLHAYTNSNIIDMKEPLKTIYLVCEYVEGKIRKHFFHGALLGS